MWQLAVSALAIAVIMLVLHVNRLQRRLDAVADAAASVMEDLDHA